MEDDGLTSVTQVQKDHVRRWLAEPPDTVSAQTARRHYSGARQWFTWQHEQEEITANPVRGHSATGRAREDDRATDGLDRTTPRLR